MSPRRTLSGEVASQVAEVRKARESSSDLGEVTAVYTRQQLEDAMNSGVDRRPTIKVPAAGEVSR